MQTRRLALKTLAALGGAPALPFLAHAQDGWPARPITVMVGAVAGGTSDNMTRAIARKLSERLGQQVLADNRPGAGSGVAATAVARATPDGYVLLNSSAAPVVFNKLLMKSMTYDPDQDFASVAVFSRLQSVLVADPKSPYRTLNDVIAAARADAGKVQFASGGALATPHLSVELLQALTRTKMTHVPYRGDAPAITDVIGGQLPLMTAGVPGVMSFIRSGALRPIAVYGATRAAQLPDVPTAAESGVPDLMVDSWLGLSAPAKTPQAVIAKLADATRWACAQDDFKKQMSDYGAESFFSTPAELDERIRKDKVVWAGIFKSLGIQPQ